MFHSVEVQDVQSVIKEKAALRAQLKLSFPDAGSRVRISREISAQLFASDIWRQAGNVFCFSGTRREIDTLPILEAALREGKTLSLPRIEEDSRMSARVVRDLSGLLPGRFGILEPPADTPVFPADALALIIVPGAAFSVTGGRLGKGGGYYDRYLSEASGIRIGICPESCIIPQLPEEPHDLRMDRIITESRTIICRP